MERNIELSCLLDYYGAFLTDRQRKLLDLHVNEDLSLGEIADGEGISRQGVHDALRRAEQQLVEMEEKLGLYRRTRETAGLIGELADEIESASMDAKEKEHILLSLSRLKSLWEEDHGV